MRTIFITGGASGIGRAVALKFASEGWFVGIGDIDAAGMAETCRLIGTDHTFSTLLDVRDRAAWDAALSGFAQVSGGIDVLFNNAGIPLGGALVDCAAEEIERTLDINLKGVIFGAQAAYPYLKARAPGSCLLNTASAAGRYGVPGGSVYGEWSEDGIAVRDLMPSFIETPLLDIAPNRKSNESIRARVGHAGMGITPAAEVGEAAWAAVHGTRLHTTVGKDAKSLAFAARFMPGAIRKRVRSSGRPLG